MHASYFMIAYHPGVAHIIRRPAEARPMVCNRPSVTNLRGSLACLPGSSNLTSDYR